MTEQSKPRAAFSPWDRRELPGWSCSSRSPRGSAATSGPVRLFECWADGSRQFGLDVRVVLAATPTTTPGAKLWHKRLRNREMNPERLTQPAEQRSLTFMDAVREPEAADLTIEKLVGVYRVLIPPLIRALRHLNGTSRITDTTIRSLKLLQRRLQDC